MLSPLTGQAGLSKHLCLRKDTLRQAQGDMKRQAQGDMKCVSLITFIIELLLLFLLAIIPSLFWLGIYLKEDRREPEPRSLLMKLFLGGILAGLVGLIIEGAILYVFFDPAFFYQKIEIAAEEAKKNNLGENIIIYVLAAPIIEEFVKYLAIKKIGFPSKYFNQIVDGVIYAVTVALGFALFENFLYFWGYLSEGIYSLIVIFVLRMFMSTLLHTLSTGWMGYWLGKAKFGVASRQKFILTGFVVAVLIHAVFNLLMITGLLFYAMLVLVVVSALFFEKIRSAGAQMFWYPDKKG